MPDSEVRVTVADVRAAAATLQGVAHRTPLLTSRSFNEAAAVSAVFKCEHLQRGGAFKIRGAYNRVAGIEPARRANGVCAYSSGNHAQAVAISAGLFGIPATICMPADAPSVKIDATRGYGADIVFYDRRSEDREAVAARVAAERGQTIVPPYDDPRIIAGQGTAALELLEETGALEALLLPVGGGGLISGCAVAAKALQPDILVIGVEPAAADDARASLDAGTRVRKDGDDTIADGLRSACVGELTWPHIRDLVDSIVTVSDDEILRAMRFLALRLKQVVEPSGAVGAAALLSGRVPSLRGHGARVGVVLSGGNADPGVLARALNDGGR